MAYVGKKPADIIATAVDTTTGTFSGDLTVDTSTLYVDSANNRVGVGETAPFAKLHISDTQTGRTSAGATGDLLVLEDDNNGMSILSSNSGQGHILFGDVDDGAAGAIAYDHSSDKIRFRTNSAWDRVIIDGSGRVMIGTTTEGAANEAEELTIAGTGGVGMTIRSTDSGTSRIYFSDGTSGTSEYAGYQIYNHSSNAMIFGTNATEAMRIDSSGNVGIGTSSPDEKLDVRGTLQVGVDGTTAGLIRFMDSGSVTEEATISSDANGGLIFGGNSGPGELIFRTGSSTERMRIDSSGNVGIGTASPNGNGLLTINAPTNNSPQIVFTENDTAKWLIGHRHDGDHFRFYDLANSAERMRINSSGNVGINESSPDTKLHISNNLAGTPIATIENTASHEASIRFKTAHSSSSDFRVGASISSSNNFEIYSVGAATARLKIDSNGTVLIGKTSSDGSASAGFEFEPPGALSIAADGAPSVTINRNTNDGSLVAFRQANSTEGTISISGTTTSYNGGHISRWSRLLDNSKDTSIVKGTVMTNLDEMVEWGDEDNEQLNKMAVSSVEGDANVAGVFVNWDNDDDWNDMNVAMTGDMVIRIAQGTTVSRGDLLMSAGDGTAKPQGDDIVRSKTIAKVTSTNVSHTYDDGTYLVPCVLMAC